MFRAERGGGGRVENQQLNARELASLFDITDRWVRKLRDDGVLVCSGKPPKYPLIENVQAYTEYLLGRAQTRVASKDAADLDKEKLQAEVRIKQAKAEMAEQELKELKGELHRAEDVEAITTDHVLYFRSMLMALPGKLAVDLAGTHTAAEQAARVKQEINFVLENLADYKYDPDEYAKRVRERQGWKDRDDDDA